MYPFRFQPARGAPRANARQKALTRWRGIDLTPLETVRARPARGLAELLPSVTSSLRIDHRRDEAEIVRVWNQLLDPSLTAHAQPCNLVRGTLFVSVDSSPWLDEIVRYRRKDILHRLQHSFGREMIQKISFRIG